MYATVMAKSLELNKRFVESLSAIELDGIMKEFVVYEIQKQDFWFDSCKFHKYLSHKYKNNELFKFFDRQERKSINLEKENKQDLNKVLFY